ncbi:MAG: DNA gyrase subunit B, partial [Pseudomonadota bacterium]
DGSHIRALLLTFFYRQMPALIEAGYLYIAQPPLYRAARGRSAVYLKDDPALDTYLIDQGIENATLTLADGGQIAGADLRERVGQMREAGRIIAALGARVGNATVVEQAALEGAFSPNAAGDPEALQAIAGKTAERLDALASENERGWRGEMGEGGGLIVTRTLRGVTETRLLTADLLGSGEGRRLARLCEDWADLFTGTAMLEIKEESAPVSGPLDLGDRIMAEGRRGVSVQRYKGLGEMNPEQLWETTLDPDVRSLLQVRISHAEEAEDVFSTLMGDLVEPRRDFIQENALNVTNLDV